jgi:hypothetical protein
MSQVSRPVQIAFLAVIAFAGVWFVALRPKAPSTASAPSPVAHSAPGVTGLKRAVGKAHGVVNDSNRAQGVPHPIAATPSAGGGSPSATAPAPASPGAAAPAPAATPPSRYHGTVGRVEQALAAHRTVAILFYNPAAPDDRAVEGALDHVNRHQGRVATFDAPISQLSRYGPITTKAAVFGSPTVVIVSPSGQAGALTGYVDPLELQQRIDDAVGPIARSHGRRRGAHRTHRAHPARPRRASRHHR